MCHEQGEERKYSVCVWLVSWSLPPAVPQIPWELGFVCVCVRGQRAADPEGAILRRCFAITCQPADMSPQRQEDGKKEGLATSGAEGDRGGRRMGERGAPEQG